MFSSGSLFSNGVIPSFLKGVGPLTKPVAALPRERPGSYSSVKDIRFPPLKCKFNAILCTGALISINGIIGPKSLAFSMAKVAFFNDCRS